MVESEEFPVRFVLMLDADDNRWLRTTANELNNLLQVISESTSFSLKMRLEDPEREKYASMARTSVYRAAHLVKMMLERTGQRESPEFAASFGATTLPTTLPPAPASPVITVPQPSVQATPFPQQNAPAATAPAPSAAPAAPLAGKLPLPNTVVPLAIRFPEIRIENPHGANELVMIVDDEDFVSLLAQRVLTDSGYKVVRAKDGFVAIDFYNKLKDEISLIILDFTMPIMDGAEVFDELRQINPRAPVVLSSGFTEQDKLKFMLAKGLRGFIPKPYTQQKLLLQVRSTLDAIKNENRL